jgi:hypothetical protein
MDVEEPPANSPLKREFILAMSIFVAMAIVGTIFGLWFVFHYAPANPTPVANPL